MEWPSFLAGYDTCCKQGLGAVRLKILLSLFLRGKDENNLLPGLHVEGSEDLIGFVTMSQLQDLFSLCWLMMCHARLRDTNGDQSVRDVHSCEMSLWKYLFWCLRFWWNQKVKRNLVECGRESRYCFENAFEHSFLSISTNCWKQIKSVGSAGTGTTIHDVVMV